VYDKIFKIKEKLMEIYKYLLETNKISILKTPHEGIVEVIIGLPEWSDEEMCIDGIRVSVSDDFPDRDRFDKFIMDALVNFYILEKRKANIS
jgi:hypothetical protein